MNRQNRISVGAVSYLNTKPLIYGFEQGMMKDRIELLFDYPSRIAASLQQDKIDVGLVPVAIIPHLREAHIITDYCIGAEDAVASVCLFSEVPLEQIEQVLLDYQSRTSVALARVLLKEYWNINPQLTAAPEDFRNHIRGTTAGVVIGDRALEQRKISPYIYDFGEAWKAYTGLPFVFAAWISNKPLDEDFIRHFSNANRYGLDRIDEVVAKHPYPVFDLKKYYTQHISYALTDLKRQGLALFLEKLRKYI
ncbi:MAG: menaquinone biosynthesis protein [Williamsia sp.]|nr:menaquinone biosynthesis protein [Williamsia sp.]